MKTPAIRSMGLALALILTLAAAPRARAYYDPGIQRWITRDPIGERGGTGLYQFVRNNPSMGPDAYGNQMVILQPPLTLPPEIVIPTTVPPVVSPPVFTPPIVLLPPSEKPLPQPKPGGPRSPPKDTVCGRDRPGECEFYFAWCQWGNVHGHRPAGDPEAYWTQDAPCFDCYDECKKTGKWPMEKCKMGGPNGPRWNPRKYKPVWPWD